MNHLPDTRYLSFDKPACYRIRVRGSIQDNWSDRLEGLAISRTHPDSQPTETALEGQLIDQAALVGVLNAIYELHLPLLSVECLDS